MHDYTATINTAKSFILVLSFHRHLVVGCAGNLCIWRARTGDLLHKFTVIPGKHNRSQDSVPHITSWFW